MGAAAYGPPPPTHHIGGSVENVLRVGSVQSLARGHVVVELRPAHAPDDDEEEEEGEEDFVMMMIMIAH